MRQRPILFSGPMVQAIMEGKKTQTRRIIKHQGDMEFDIGDPHYGPYWLPYATDAHGENAQVRCPYGKPGDRLWVRETWALVPATAYRCSTGVQQTLNPGDPDTCAVYRDGWERSKPGSWRPSIFMPRWASRIMLEITGVRVERLQKISGPDCWEEGISHAGWDPERYGSVVECYRDLWDSINARNRPKLPSNPNSRRYARVKAWLETHPDTTSWDANPWVWVVEFRWLPPEDAPS